MTSPYFSTRCGNAATSAALESASPDNHNPAITRIPYSCAKLKMVCSTIPLIGSNEWIQICLCGFWARGQVIEANVICNFSDDDHICPNLSSTQTHGLLIQSEGSVCDAEEARRRGVFSLMVTLSICCFWCTQETRDDEKQTDMRDRHGCDGIIILAISFLSDGCELSVGRRFLISNLQSSKSRLSNSLVYEMALCPAGHVEQKFDLVQRRHIFKLFLSLFVSC